MRGEGEGRGGEGKGKGGQEGRVEGEGKAENLTPRSFLKVGAYGLDRKFKSRKELEYQK